MNDETSLKQVGSVVSITGSVVDIRFDRCLPPIHTILYAGHDRRVIIEVLLPAHAVLERKLDGDKLESVEIKRVLLLRFIIAGTRFMTDRQTDFLLFILCILLGVGH